MVSRIGAWFQADLTCEANLGSGSWLICLEAADDLDIFFIDLSLPIPPNGVGSRFESQRRKSYLALSNGCEFLLSEDRGRGSRPRRSSDLDNLQLSNGFLSSDLELLAEAGLNLERSNDLGPMLHKLFC